MNEESKYRIKIMKNGPYIVSGGVPLSERIITPSGGGYVFEPGCDLPQAKTYSLCRCGKSKNAPFCDGAHETAGFNGTLTASKRRYRDRAELLEGLAFDMLDDKRCAFARFCHRDAGSAWELIKQAQTPEQQREAYLAAYECPSGRLTAITKDGEDLDPALDPSIVVMQDPEEGVSCALFVQGGIPIEGEDGLEYETRNRVALCRCGKSRIKPFCDAMHIAMRYRDR